MLWNNFWSITCTPCADPEGGRAGGLEPPENDKNIGFLNAICGLSSGSSPFAKIPVKGLPESEGQMFDVMYHFQLV